MYTDTRRIRATALIAVVLILYAAGCSDDDGPAVPGTETGTVVVDTEPDSLGAPWILNGPGGFCEHGAGDRTFTGESPGDYAMTWGNVPRWITPADERLALAVDATVTFNGIYKKGPTGTIEIDQEPDALVGAGWSVSGPQNETGSGDATLSDMPVGNYTLSWSDVGSYVTPPGSTQTLEEDSTITFGGTYEYFTSGTIEIDQTPNGLVGGAWSLTGPQNETGSGDTTLAYMPVGDYTMSWSYVSGCIVPSGQTLTLVEGSTVTFLGEYVKYFERVPAGTFDMGSPPDELGRYGNELQHEVTLTTPFYVFNTEVTNRRYANVMQWAYDNGYCTASVLEVRDALDGSTRELIDLASGCPISFSNGTFVVSGGMDNHPVAWVTWYGAAAYCDWLSLREGLPRAYNHSTWQCNGNDPYNAEGYRLPTEAEWEYACRGGGMLAFANGPITDTECADPVLDLIGWYCGNAYNGKPVALLIPNYWGLYDMHGNVFEWCNDWYTDYAGDETDPVGSATGTVRSIRGGYWGYYALRCRSATRAQHNPAYSHVSVGFRPVRSAE